MKRKLTPENYAKLLNQECQKYGIDKKKSVAPVLEQLMITPTDKNLLWIIEYELADAKQLQQTRPDPFRPTNPINDGIFSGVLLLGAIPPEGLPYIITPESLLTHMLIASRSGGGKSNLIFLLLSQLLDSTPVSIKLFDRKFEYYPLMSNKNFTYWYSKGVDTNILEPAPGVAFERHISTVAELFGNTHDMRVASRGLLVRVALILYKKPEFSGSGRYPTLKDVYKHLLSMKIPLISLESRHRETLINRLEGIFSIFGDHLCSQRQMIWDNFINMSWAIAIDGIPTDYQNFFINVTCAKIMSYAVVNNLRNNKLKILFCFDESSSIFRKFQEQREGNYLLLDYLAQAREFGIGFVIATQSLSNLPDSVLSNTGIKIMVGGSGSGTDYDIFASATGMTSEQKTYLKQLTKPGQACVKDPRYEFPFTMEVPHVVE